MIYFDNAATTRVNDEVLDSFNTCIKNYFGNSSSLHKEGLKAGELEKKASKQIASFFNANEDEVIFTSGATEANNLALKGTAFYYQKRGKHIITSKVEHLSVLSTIKHLEEEYGFDVTYLDVDSTGKISIEDLKKSIREDTILVSIMAVNNEVGTIMPIEQIASMLKSFPKIHFHVDATQAIGKIDINYKDVDLITLSAHKIHGFKCSGLLIKRKTTNLVPLLNGGGHQNNLRSGTTSSANEVALAKTIRLAFLNQAKSYDKISKLNKYLREKLLKIEGVIINSSEDSSPFILSFVTPKKGSVVAEALSNKNIFVSTKSACSSKKVASSYVLEAMNLSDYIAQNSIRLSFSDDNDIQEIDIFIDELKQILNTIK